MNVRSQVANTIKTRTLTRSSNHAVRSTYARLLLVKGLIVTSRPPFKEELYKRGKEVEGFTGGLQ
jgi:hypothetical protein